MLVVFGATGDLFKKKLAKAIFDLYAAGNLPRPFRIVGFSRKPLSHDDFRANIREILTADKSFDALRADIIDSFTRLAYYQKGDITDLGTYAKLGETLEKMDREANVCMNKLFYLAVSPLHYKTIFENLSKSGLTIPCAPTVPEHSMAWYRVLVEKPFGSDETEAMNLDKLLGRFFKEEQIYRIDHYLAKETIQNILTFRFSNTLFESLWNKENISRVEIKILESTNVSARGSFYDSIGALKDMGQSHILSMLALITMENPGALSPDAIRKARAKVVPFIKPYDKRPDKYVVRGQYEGYVAESAVNPVSQTETYFKIKVKVANKRWRSVPFYLESGKALGEAKSEIIIYFKEPKTCICPPSIGNHTHENILTFRIQPNEGITVLFWAKNSGFDFGLDAKQLSFLYNGKEGFETRKFPDAYERVLYDCIRGDQTLFSSTDEVMAQWKFITPVVRDLSSVPLVIYKQGENPEVRGAFSEYDSEYQNVN